MKKIILASGSPRRKELLELAGLDFEIRVSDVDETLPEEIEPETAVEMLSKRKAEATASLYSSDYVVIGADTVVAVDGRILGKPKNIDDAKRMLGLLSGKTHSVYTGVTFVSGEEERTFSVKSDVVFYELTGKEINDYVSTGEPLDKAGAYGIQGKGSLLIKSINGDYFNIVGLPISRLVRELKAFISGG